MNLLEILRPQTPAPIVGARLVCEQMPEYKPAPQTLIKPRDYPRVLAMRKAGYTFKDIGHRMGVSASQVRRLVIRLGAK